MLLIGRDGRWLLGLMLTSQDRRSDGARPPGRARPWVEIGTGPWDRARRPSSVRVDRIIRIHPRTVRREGAVLDRVRFEQVAAAVRPRADSGQPATGTRDTSRRPVTAVR